MASTDLTSRDGAAAAPAADPRTRPVAAPDAQPIVELDGLSLRYRLATQRIPSIKEYAIHWMKGTLSYEDLWALQDIDLTVEKGQALGVVGRNGAGKSSLLKVISKVLPPTRGKVTVRGRVSPMLELGTGFDAELTGHENIYLNGLLLGHSRKEIEAQEGEIVEFSGLKEFIHSPVRSYSSGMTARLGFAIATAWLPELLILDEVLAVGDARFIQRCEKRIQEFLGAGSTMILVSHDLDAVRANCNRCIWLDQGTLQAEGPTDEVIAEYTRFAESSDTEDAPDTRRIPRPFDSERDEPAGLG